MFLARVVIVNAFARYIERAKPDNDDMHVRHAARFADPRKGSMREMDFKVPSPKQLRPKNADLLALCNGIGGNKADWDLRSFDVLGGLAIPASHIIKHTGTSQVAPDYSHVLLLL